MQAGTTGNSHRPSDAPATEHSTRGQRFIPTVQWSTWGVETLCVLVTASTACAVCTLQHAQGRALCKSFWPGMQVERSGLQVAGVRNWLHRFCTLFSAQPAFDACRLTRAGDS